MRRKLLLGSAALLLSMMVKSSFARGFRISRPKSSGSISNKRNHSDDNQGTGEWSGRRRVRVVPRREDEESNNYDTVGSEYDTSDDDSYSAFENESDAFEEDLDVD